MPVIKYNKVPDKVFLNHYGVSLDHNLAPIIKSLLVAGGPSVSSAESWEGIDERLKGDSFPSSLSVKCLPLRELIFYIGACVAKDMSYDGLLEGSETLNGAYKVPNSNFYLSIFDGVKGIDFSLLYRVDSEGVSHLKTAFNIGTLS